MQVIAAFKLVLKRKEMAEKFALKSVFKCFSHGVNL